MKFLTRSSLLLKSAHKYCTKINNVPQVFPMIHMDQQNIAQTVLKIKQTVPNDNVWSEIRTELLTKHSVREQVLDGVLIDAFVAEMKDFNKSAEVAKSYLHFLQNNNLKINIAVVYKLLKILSYADNNEDNQKTILWLYENIIKKLPAMDTELSSMVVIGLCLTNKWREAEQIVDSANTPGKSSWIAACYKNNEPEIGFKYLQKLDDEKILGGDIIKVYLQYCIKTHNDKKAQEAEFEKLLKLCRIKKIVLSKHNADSLIENCSLLDWHGTNVTMNLTGNCPNCGSTFTKSYLHKSECDLLSKLILEKVLISSDIFQGSNPNELKKFIDYVEKTRPYDIVIDGLNLYYKNNSSGVLPIVIEKFAKKDKKILILARRHLRRQVKAFSAYKNLHIFFVDDSTRDDSYMLYAALKSGKHTKFISNDLMRGQKFKLDDVHHQMLFKQWQTSNHLIIKHIDYRNRKCHFKNALQFPIIVYEDNNGWHIPFTDKAVLPDLYGMLETWVCLRKSKK